MAGAGGVAGGGANASDLSAVLIGNETSPMFMEATVEVMEEEEEMDPETLAVLERCMPQCR